MYTKHGIYTENIACKIITMGANTSNMKQEDLSLLSDEDGKYLMRIININSVAFCCCCCYLLLCRLSIHSWERRSCISLFEPYKLRAYFLWPWMEYCITLKYKKMFSGSIKETLECFCVSIYQKNSELCSFFFIS